MQIYVNYWKCLWRWTTSQNLSSEDLQAVLGKKEVQEALFQGLLSYKPNSPGTFSQLESKYPDQVKLLNTVQTLQNYIDVDSFQIWDLIKHYLCSISYGNITNALKNIAFLDTRPTFILPNVWKFYYCERLFLLRLLQYIIENKNNANHKYHKEFSHIYNTSGANLMSSLVGQFEKVTTSTPPPRKIHNDFGNETIRQEWAEYNLREQLALLQLIILLIDEENIPVEHFQTLFKAFRRCNFGKNQSYHELLEERHRDMCMKIVYLETCLFIVVSDKQYLTNPSSWIEVTEKFVEPELTKLQLGAEHTPMLLSWMVLSLESKDHAVLFESKYQHYGSTALRMHVFEFLHEMVKSPVLSDQSKCSKIIRETIFKLLNAVCDRFDGDGTVSRQPGIYPLCAELISSQDLADEFWNLHQKNEHYGIVSLWNTALEYFPYNFNMLSVLAAGLSQAGKSSVRNLIGELKNLPVYTEIYNPNSVPLMSSESDVAIIGREYSPIPSYTVEVGSRATVMERREGTMIHFHTPCSYWTVFNHEIEKALDRNQHHHLNDTLQRVYEGTELLTGAVRALGQDGRIPAELMRSCEGAFEALVRFARADAALPLLAAGLRLCAALLPAAPAAPDAIHLRLVNAGVLPRVAGGAHTAAECAGGAGGGALDAGAVGAHLAGGALHSPRPAHLYDLLDAYVHLLCAFHENCSERVARDILLPGVVMVAREGVGVGVGAGVGMGAVAARRRLAGGAAALLARVLQPGTRPALLLHTALHVLHYTDCARDVLAVISIGNERLESMMLDESNWVSGPSTEWGVALQRYLAAVLFALRHKTAVAAAADVTPLERLVLAQNKRKDPLKVVPRITGYIDHVFNKSLPVLTCRLLKRLAESFQMSLFASLDMTAYQVRVMFLDRLRDEHESVELKVAILEFVATCVGKQPGLTEAFFMMNHERAKEAEREGSAAPAPDEGSEGILGYMADYLATVKSDAELLPSPLLGCTMALFHALWKNNMQILVKKLRENPKFWEYITSPLFAPIRPGLRIYSQIFNVLGIELFAARGRPEPALGAVLERFFDPHRRHLDDWVEFAFSFRGRGAAEEAVDEAPAWLGLLASWKDFATIVRRSPPVELNIAHKSKIAAPCLTALGAELEGPADARPVALLAELYVALLAAWRDDCFEDRRRTARQLGRLLTAAHAAYEGLPPRAARALLALAAAAVGALDYEIRADAALARRVVAAVADVNGLELARALDEGAPGPPEPPGAEPSTAVLALALLERALDLPEEGGALGPETGRLVDDLLRWLRRALGRRERAGPALAALRCLVAGARGPLADELLHADVEGALWLRLARPAGAGWAAGEWARVLGAGLEVAGALVAAGGARFAGAAVALVAMQADQLAEALAAPDAAAEALALRASALALVLRLLRFEAIWRMQNVNSLIVIMRSVSVCLCHSVGLCMRARRDPSPAAAPPGASPPPPLQCGVRLLRLAAATLARLSPPLLALLAPERAEGARFPPLLELHFGAPKLAPEPQPRLCCGTLLAAICLLTRILAHAHHAEEAGGSRSPRGRRRACSCGSPGAGAAGAGAGGRVDRSESVTSASSAASAAPPPDERLAAAALEATATLLASQALLAIRDPSVPARHKQLIRRELSSELAVFHDYVRKRVLCAAHARPHLARTKLGAWPLPADERELELLRRARASRPAPAPASAPAPAPAPAKRPAPDSMREYILRKHHLEAAAAARAPPSPPPPPPVCHSTPAPAGERGARGERAARACKRVSWAETARDPDDDLDSSLAEIDAVYSNLTDVRLNEDEDYLHFMSVVFLYVCRTEL